MDTSNRQPTRRSALWQIAGGATIATGVFPILGQNPPPESHHSVHPVTKEAAAYKYQFFSPQQLETLDALGETIIPTDDHSPGARAAHVSEYIDAIVSDAMETTKGVWAHGLADVERVAHEKFQLAYPHCSLDQQTAILTGMEDSAFFNVLKRATVDGYYTSAIGILEELQYNGNQALADFPGCQHSEGGMAPHE